MSYDFIPVCRPLLTGKEEEYLVSAIRGNDLSSAGKFVPAFERAFSALVDCEQGVACANGTAAVHLALLAAGVGPGDRVVVPSFTMMGSVFPIIYQGAIPVFVDVTPDTWTLSAEALARIEGPVKAVVAVHMYGHPCDMGPIVEWARTKGASVIEDAAEGHGARYRGKVAGSLGDIAAFSFYANKTLTCGEGGMVTTNHPELAERARYYRNLCFEKDPQLRFQHGAVGFNYRMGNLQAAVGLAQTESAGRLIESRQEMARKYLTRLAPLADRIQLPVEREWATNAFWVFGIVLGDRLPLDSREVRERLLAEKIETRPFFYPAHRQPSLVQFSQAVTAPVSERLWERGLYLPSAGDLTDAEADRVVESLTSIIARL